MENLQKFFNVLKAVDLLSSIGGGRGNPTCGEVAYWSGVPKSTCYRYLKKACGMKMVQRLNVNRRRQECFGYAILPRGRMAWRSQGQLVNFSQEELS